MCCVAGVGRVEGTDGSSARLGVEGGQVAGGVGLREVPVWSAVERVDVRCRFKTGPVEEVRFERIARMGLTCPVQSVAQG